MAAEPRVAGARRRGGPPAPSLTSRSDRRASAHQRRGMQSDVVLDLGWGRLVFGHTFGDLRGVLDALRAE